MPEKPNPFMKKPLAEAQAAQKAKKENPFLRPPKGKEGVKPKGPPKISEEEWEEKRMMARLMLKQKGIKVGDEVKLSWEYDRAYGPGTATHHGIVTEIANVLRCDPCTTSNGKLLIPLTAVKTIDKVEKVASEDSKFKAKKPNPFMKS